MTLFETNCSRSPPPNRRTPRCLAYQVIWLSAVVVIRQKPTTIMSTPSAEARAGKTLGQAPCLQVAPGQQQIQRNCWLAVALTGEHIHQPAWVVRKPKARTKLGPSPSSWEEGLQNHLPSAQKPNSAMDLLPMMLMLVLALLKFQ